MKNTLDKLRNLPGSFKRMNSQTKAVAGISAFFILPVIFVMAGIALIGLGLSLPFLLSGRNKRIFRSFYFRIPGKNTTPGSNGTPKIDGDHF